jgi:ankyrin repeat protein
MRGPAIRRGGGALVLCLTLGLACIGPAGAAAYDDFIQAVQNSRPKEVAALLKRGMDPNSVDTKGQPVLHIAARENNLEVVQALVAAGADIDRRNPLKETPIMLACLTGSTKIVEFLLSKDAQINHPGWTPLLYAATNGHADIVKLLLDNSAYIDSAAPNGTTPLMMAVRGGYIDTVRLLLDEGADPTLKNENGDTATSWALKAKQTDMAALIGVKLKSRK